MKVIRDKPRKGFVNHTKLLRDHDRLSELFNSQTNICQRDSRETSVEMDLSDHSILLWGDKRLPEIFNSYQEMIILFR
jgi:hypothetical protein